jgi:hypothetical protein
MIDSESNVEVNQGHMLCARSLAVNPLGQVHVRPAFLGLLGCMLHSGLILETEKCYFCADGLN